MGIAYTWVKDQEAPRWMKVFVVFATVVISLSTAFVKQHSMVDVLVALPVSLLAEILVFGKSYWLPRIQGKPRGDG